MNRNKKLNIDETFVSNLVTNQFPQWKNLPVWPVTHSGWDNKTFHLGSDMLIRMPSAEKYAVQVEKEHRWLPKLGPLLPLEIPRPLEMGQPSNEYPWKWSIYQWIEGDLANPTNIADLCKFAHDLAEFLNAMQAIDPTDGPLPGDHNFFRGGSLEVYDSETRQAINLLKDKIDTNRAVSVWESAIKTSWQKPPVWLHGDISVGNILVRNEQLNAVIDFGMLAIGDPACDLAIAWSFFEGKSREVFRTTLSVDDNTWIRGQAWALWKALIIAAGLTVSNTHEAPKSCYIINEVLKDYEF